MKIAVIGAGPAGLACSIQLTKNGHDVTVFESKSDIDHQGSGVLIQPVGLAALALLGLDQKIIELGRRIEAILGSDSINNKTIVDVDYRKLKQSPYAIGIDRTNLWHLLFQKCNQVGVQLVLQTTIKKYKSISEHHYEVIDINDQSYRDFELVVDASGANSPLISNSIKPVVSKVQSYGSLWTKLPLHDTSYFNQNLMRHYSIQDNIGIGILPTGAGYGNHMATIFFNLRWADWQPENFIAWKKSIVQQWPNTETILQSLTSPEQLYLAKFRQHALLHPYGKGIVFIGDAAHTANPQLGQGINMSLIDAVVLPWALQSTNKKNLQSKLILYAKLRSKHVWLYQTLAKLLTPFYQSSNKQAITLRNTLYPILNQLPLFKKFTTYILSGQLSNPLKKIK